jgi:hypothetical protein
MEKDKNYPDLLSENKIFRVEGNEGLEMAVQEVKDIQTLLRESFKE